MKKTTYVILAALLFLLAADICLSAYIGMNSTTPIDTTLYPLE